MARCETLAVGGRSCKASVVICVCDNVIDCMEPSRENNESKDEAGRAVQFSKDNDLIGSDVISGMLSNILGMQSSVDDVQLPRSNVFKCGNPTKSSRSRGSLKKPFRLASLGIRNSRRCGAREIMP